MMLSKIEIGRLVREARIKKELKVGKKFTQQMLADTVHKSRSYIGDIESGRIYPNYVLLSKIAEACMIKLSFFGEMDNTLDNIIKKNYPDMTIEERKDFAKLISLNINQVDYELELDTLKIIYDDQKNNEDNYYEEDDHSELDQAEYASYLAQSDELDEIDKDMKAIIEALKNASPKKKAKILKMIELFEDEK